jgi:hypothetical protein
MMALDTRSIVLCLSAWIATGCFTGELIESGRMHERVRSYERIAIVDATVYVDYTTEVATELPRRNTDWTIDTARSNKKRSATFPLAELTVRPERPVDTFPLLRIPYGRHEGRALPIAIESGSAEADGAHFESHAPDPPDGLSADASPDSLVARIDAERGRHQGFGLCPATGGRCVGYFHSAALYDDPIAWWVYPIAPFAFAADIAVLPIHVVTLPILIAISD